MVNKSHKMRSGLSFSVWIKHQPRIETWQIANQIRTIADAETQSELMASTFILSGLVLEESAIQRVLRMDILEESVTYQLIKRQGLEQGLEQERSLIIRQLGRKVGQLPTNIENRVKQLSFAQLDQLGEALLDFASLNDPTKFLSEVDINYADDPDE
ncbi:MAG: DUF4351 domain-containing protein [Cyanobacteria bacterium J06623_5]